jgi:hypothetical protein
MSPHRVISSLLFLALLPAATLGQDTYKIEVLKQPPPSTLAGPVRDTLAVEGFRIVNGQGQAFAEIWLRKLVPASEPPAPPKGPVQFPFLAEGDLLGALRFVGEGHDFRDQAIAKGVYTIRFGLQPQNGDHNGSSEYRDFALLIPAAKDTTLAALQKKPLEERSAESAGTTHPAVFVLLNAPASTPSSSGPAITRDEQKDTWGAVIPMNLDVKGTSSPMPFRIQIIFIGAAMV